MSVVKKAVIPVAGYGTRFLPFTKSVPKSMLPILNRPAIEFVTDEAIASGIEEILIVAGYKQDIVESYFETSYELEKKINNEKILEEIRYPNGRARISFITQPKSDGTAKAIELAKEFVGEDPFAVLFGDDILVDEIPVTKQLIDMYEKTHMCVIGCKEFSKEEVVKYSSVECSLESEGFSRIEKITEKPDINSIRSNLSTIGRYVFNNNIFDGISSVVKRNGEYQLTDAIGYVAKKYGAVAYELKSIKYDMGSIPGFLKANVEQALRDEIIGPEFKKYLKEIIK